MPGGELAMAQAPNVFLDPNVAAAALLSVVALLTFAI